jgi:hypothetical protein
MDYAFGIVEPWSYERRLPSAHEEFWDEYPIESENFILTEEPDNYCNGPFTVITPAEVEDYLELANKDGIFLSGDPLDLFEIEEERDLPENKVFHRYPLKEHIDITGAVIEPEEVLPAIGLTNYRVESLEDILEYQ